MRLPTSKFGITAVCAVLSFLLIAALALVVQVSSDATLPVFALVTWAITLAPGIVLLIISPIARRYWWRHPLVWVLTTITLPGFSEVVLFVGHAWVWREVWLRKTESPAHL